MKKVLAVLCLMIMSTSASAWVCRAESPSAWGESAWYANLWEAKQVALNYCAARTPYYQTCVVVWCN